MARMGDIRRAIAARLRPLVPDDVQIYAFLPDAAMVPCVWIEPDRTFENYQVTFQGSSQSLKLLITFAVNRMDEESAQDSIDDYLDSDGPFVDGLQGMTADPKDELTALISYVNVLTAGSYGTYKVGDTYYFGAQLSIEVLI